MSLNWNIYLENDCDIKLEYIPGECVIKLEYNSGDCVIKLEYIPGDCVIKLENINLEIVLLNWCSGSQCRPSTDLSANSTRLTS